ncbi:MULTISPECIES: alpha-amylase family glycosyl hydrolase [Dictyoglomus]|uniref:Alpha amylase catalytic region n=1 Tax=Dictyoglomus turgidum (strain DSM 6724 / Z-1310) TaxID=515635 RepID=B8DZZ2_DICTD|nr:MULTISPECIES: alpha-amylase family glycosyl hydrolase [Dictyoglomus]ACK42075.1 alpha amylase catalytic region [Dictyoglomus turgidum DSM 6724]HBU32306.1 hypothetical protein [Dictyoglomus sp.]
MIYDDKIFGDLSHREFLAEREAKKLEEVNLEEIFPEDPKPEDEIEITFSCPINFYPNSVQIIREDKELYTLNVYDRETQWNDSVFNFSEVVKIKIPALKEKGVYQIRLFSIDKKFYEYYFPIDNHEPPKWSDESIIYHIFIDRFAKDDKEVILSKNLKEKLGGNLKGIISHLDYIENLGVNVIWISPIFKSTSYHGYDIEDYFEIDPLWGTKEDLKRLVNEAFKRGIRVILDFVPNHMSHNNPLFQEALNNKNSKLRDWFLFKGDDYESFFGVKSMPKINLRNKEAMEYIINAAKYWIKEFGISGYRMDHATGPDINFWTIFYYRMKSEFPDTFYFGEIVETPKETKKYIDKFDGTLDFYLFKIIRDFFIGKSWEPKEFLRIIDLENKFYGDKFKRLSFLENHDSNRFLWVAKDKNLLKLASIFQFSLNPIPIVYNGQEMGCNQFRDIIEGNKTLHEYTRLPIPWDEGKQDKELIEFYKKLINIRKKHPSLYKGRFIPILSNLVSFIKEDEEESILVLINPNHKEEIFNLNGIYKDLFSGNIYTNSLKVNPMNAHLLLRINH